MNVFVMMDTRGIVVSLVSVVDEYLGSSWISMHLVDIVVTHKQKTKGIAMVMASVNIAWC